MTGKLMTVLLAILAAGCLLVMVLLMASAAEAHAWYGQKRDPVFGTGCCGGSDCKELDGGLVTAETDGYRIRLTLAQTQAINPWAFRPIDALVTWDRVQPSEDGNWHLCIFSNDRTEPRRGIICLFQPADM